MKFYNSLKFRFVVFFTVFIVVLCATISVSAVRNTIQAVSEVFAVQGIAVAEKAAKAINGDAFERLSNSMDPEDPFYEEARLKLLEIKDTAVCEYLYTMAPFRGTIYRYIIDGSVPPGDTENFSALGDEEDTVDYDPAFALCWAKKSTQYGGLEYQEGWGWMVSIYAPIFNSRGTMVGIVGCDFDAENLNTQIRRETLRQIVIALVFLLAGMGLMFFFIRMIFGRLKNVNVLLREISRGKGDLTKRINLLHKDEIGELGEHFNKTMEKINGLVTSIKVRTGSLSDIGTDLSENMNETAAAIKQMSGTIQDIKEQVLNQSASVTETNATMEQVSKNIDLLNTHVEMQTASVAQSSSAIEEMLANIGSVTKTLVHNAENVGKLTAASEEGRTGLEEVSRDIQEIAKESEGLLEINSVMENIASQTNLLSMNAAIEAAHAGESGKGFAVVADEIRKLAVNSSDQSRIISDVLKKIKASIDKITGSTDAVLRDFQAIDSLVRTVSNEEENIRNAMEEQGQGSQQILEAVGKLNELTQQVKAGSGEMLEGSIQVIKESRSLEEVTRKISGNIGEMATGADHINTAVRRVNEISHTNKEHIDALAEEVLHFKVEEE